MNSPNIYFCPEITTLQLDQQLKRVANRRLADIVQMLNIQNGADIELIVLKNDAV